LAKNIEDTIFENSLPVNTLAMFHRGIEILEKNNTNNPMFLNEEAKVQYRRLLWLICSQIYGQMGQIDFDEEWRNLVSERRVIENGKEE
jgi:hypothetical protein